MSLLLQALQKAAKNRDEATGKTPVSEEDSDRLTLQPLAEPQLREDAAAKDETESDTSSSPEDAAGVMRASELPGYSAIDWARDHYMLTFVAGAALFAILYGLYVYVQISSPGMFRSTPPPATTPIQASATPAPAQMPTAPAAAASGQPHISGLPDDATPAEKLGSRQLAVADKGDMAATPVSEPKTIEHKRTAPAVAMAAKQPAHTKPAAIAAKPTPQQRPVSSRDASARIDKDGVEVVEIPLGPSVTPVAKEAQAPAKKDLTVQAENPAYSKIDPVLMLAYEALQRGDYEKATVLYSEVLSRTPDSIDAMLGLAAIAWKQGRPTVASQYYGRVLEVEPRNTHAQAGLIAILGNVDPVAGEARLQQLIDRDPSGFLYFTLGNLYAQQNLWSQAQQAYFRALQFQPDNADYAYNLAVGLEHLGKTRHALEYYRKALDLSFKNGRANFDQKLAIERVGQLSARVD